MNGDVMNTIHDKWQYFKKQYVFDGTREDEVAQVKAGFYAGAATMLDFMVGISSGELSEEAAAGIMAGLHEELLLYVGETVNETNSN